MPISCRCTCDIDINDLNSCSLPPCAPRTLLPSCRESPRGSAHLQRGVSHDLTNSLPTFVSTGASTLPSPICCSPVFISMTPALEAARTGLSTHYRYAISMENDRNIKEQETWFKGHTEDSLSLHLRGLLSSTLSLVQAQTWSKSPRPTPE